MRYSVPIGIMLTGRINPTATQTATAVFPTFDIVHHTNLHQLGGRRKSRITPIRAQTAKKIGMIFIQLFGLFFFKYGLQRQYCRQYKPCEACLRW